MHLFLSRHLIKFMTVPQNRIILHKFIIFLPLVKVHIVIHMLKNNATFDMEVHVASFLEKIARYDFVFYGAVYNILVTVFHAIKI